MNDEQILACGGDKHDIESFAKQNGADLSHIDVIKHEMLTQNKRGTSFPIFIVVRDERIYGVDSNHSCDGRERKEDLGEDDVCEVCWSHYQEYSEFPEECDDGDCDESFVNYRIEKDVPQMRAAFFFTAEACNAHIEANRHHYGRGAHSYAISAYHNPELKEVMAHLVGEEGVKTLS